MNRGLNKVMIIGYLGKDPEMRYTPSGRAVTTYSVAVNRSYVSADGEKKIETEWFNVIAWGSLAEISAQYLTKGERVYVEGRLQSRRWEDSDGIQHNSVEIVASEMLILGYRDMDNTDI
jgi:single-strand DNA-binding protein